MNQHPIFDHFCRLSCGLLMLAFSASFSGCGSAPASLAVEGTGAAALPDVTAGTMPTPAAEAVSQPVPETASSALQPKLTTVDRNQLVGCWRDSFFGTRTLTLNSDGTAAMVLELDFAGRLLYGSRLDFDMV